jgi:hypothetical protein
MHTLLLIQDLPTDAKTIVLAIFIFTIMVVTAVWILVYKTSPNFTWHKNSKTGKYYIAKKSWYGYVCIERYDSAFEAEYNCELKNKLSK